MTGVLEVLVQALVWYAALGLVGLLALPLSAYMLRFLPDRGLAFARPVGLVIAGYAFWLLATLGVVQNDTGGVVVALLLLAGLSAWALWRGRGGTWRAAWLQQRRALPVMEMVFVLAFVLWVFVRAASPQASGTEKPMELAFIQSILRSASYPPADPWLSGYAISYYYFGYSMVAMLARLTGFGGTLAFNLASASWFAMTALAAYGLLYNLLHVRQHGLVGNPIHAAKLRAAALLAPLFLLVMSNGGGLLEVLHSGGVFWSGGQSRFWSWLNIPELVNPPTPPYTFTPERSGGIWWWRSSRVISDYGLDGGFHEVIDEFPLFSYLLGDLHPHVLAMPFVLLAAALALNVFRMLHEPEQQPFGWHWLRRPTFWLTALLLGALAFLNTWDWPMYLVLFGAAAALAGVSRASWHWGLVADFAVPVFALGLAGALLYLPFFLSFSSQAQGILPSLVFFTRGAHLWVMFGPLLLPIIAWLVAGWWRGPQPGRALGGGLLLAGALLLALLLLMLAFALLRLQVEPALAGIWGASSSAQLLAESLQRRLSAPGAWITLWLLLGLVIALLRREPQPGTLFENGWGADRFVLLLVMIGAGLVVFPEFFYLRDGFGTRMNTIFKFAFQAWVLWAVAAGYGAYAVLHWLAGARKFLYAAALALVVAASLPYGLFWVSSRFDAAAFGGFSLDGTALALAEQQAVEWLADAPYGVVAEAIGGSYTGYARISTHSGLPTVLGWPGHELQWRGGVQEMGTRQGDIEQLYRARNWEEAQNVIDRYNIRYIVIGALEQSTYRPDEELFRRNLQASFQNEGITIYTVSPSLDD